MSKKIHFYFDFLSPYAYVAWTWVRSQSYDFVFHPISIPSLVSHYDAKGPAQINPKRNYLFKDLLRYTALNNVPFNPPKNSAFNSLHALRLSLKSVAKDRQKEVIDAIFKAAWEKGMDIGSDDVLKEVLEASGLPSKELFLKMEESSSRMELKNNVEEAINAEVFGVPTFLVDDEIFWGNDAIKYMEMFLEGRDPLDQDKYKLYLQKQSK